MIPPDKGEAMSRLMTAGAVLALLLGGSPGLAR